MSADGRELGRRTARGFVWAIGAAVGGRLLTVAALAVVARILVPRDFGLFTFALVYVTYLNTVADLGVGTALIYRSSRIRESAQAAFWVNAAMGVVLCLFTLWIAPFAADFFGSPAGVPVLRTLSVVFLLRGVANTHDALCRKELRFRERMLPELGLAGVKGVLTVVLAVAGFGVWSLVWGQILGTVAWAVALWWIVPWRPDTSWPRGVLGPLLDYGKAILALNVVAVVVHHADEVLVGRMLGMDALGYYQMGYKVPEMAVVLILWQVNTVLFPALSKARASGEDLGAGYVEAVRWVALLAVPTAVGLYLLAEPLVFTLFGDQWGPSVPVLRVLAVYAALRALRSPAGDVLKASGRPGLLAGLGVVKAVVLVPALIVAAGRSTVAVGIAMAAVAALTLPMDVWFAHRLTRFRPRALFAAVGNSVGPTAAMAAALAAWMAVVPDPSGPLALAVGVAGGGLLYLGAVRLMAPAAFRQAVAALAPSPPASESPDR